MVIPTFNLARSPKIIFGPGCFKEIAGHILPNGRHIVLVSGAHSFKDSAASAWLAHELRKSGITVVDVPVAGEPTPELVDNAVAALSCHKVDVVVAVGGGSVLDAGKAISAMLPLQESVREYLEGVGGGKKHPGAKVPFIAVPTTSGTGTEATKNASLRQVGEAGFKNSLRHDNFVPDIALVDPELALTCPPAITAACGMDAFAQLLESYVSPQASPVTDVLSLSGLEAASRHLLPAYQEGDRNLPARTGMAYAALVSGITLANAGLGIVHSLSSVIGGFFDIPHGAICGTMIGPGTRMNLLKMWEQPQAYNMALQKHARAGALLAGRELASLEEGCDQLVRWIESTIGSLRIPTLGAFGVSSRDVDRIAAKTAIRNNPVPLLEEDIRQLLRMNLQAG